MRILLFTLMFAGFVVQAAVAEELANKIVVFKSDRKMELQDSSGTVIKVYDIALGGDPVGHKTQEGDEKTPEGIYEISARKEDSAYHRSLRISYPNDADKAQAKERNVSPGGDIMIHGIRNGFGWIGEWHLFYDKWTDGCIAVTNDEIEEVWSLVKDGTPIEIKP